MVIYLFYGQVKLGGTLGKGLNARSRNMNSGGCGPSILLRRGVKDSKQKSKGI